MPKIKKNKNKTRNPYSENTKKVEGSTVLGEIVADEAVVPSKLAAMLTQLKKDQDEWFSKHGGRELFEKNVLG